MNFKKKCPYCHHWFCPKPWNYRRQKACSRKECQRMRHRRADRLWHLKNPTYDDGREKEHQGWREKNHDYWKRYRKTHPIYVKRNRRLQKKRDARKRGILANQDGWDALHRRKLSRIRCLGHLAKQDGSPRSLLRHTEQICRYLDWARVLAKQDSLDRKKASIS